MISTKPLLLFGLLLLSIVSSFEVDYSNDENSYQSEELGYQSDFGTECTNYAFNFTTNSEDDCPTKIMVFNLWSMMSTSRADEYNTFIYPENTTTACLLPHFYNFWTENLLEDLNVTSFQQSFSSANLDPSMLGQKDRPSIFSNQHAMDMKNQMMESFANEEFFNMTANTTSRSCGTLHIYNLDEGKLEAERDFTAFNDTTLFAVGLGMHGCPPTKTLVNINVQPASNLWGDNFIFWFLADSQASKFQMSIGPIDFNSCFSNYAADEFANVFCALSVGALELDNAGFLGNATVSLTIVDSGADASGGVAVVEEVCYLLESFGDNECNVHDEHQIKLRLVDVPYESQGDITWNIYSKHYNQDDLTNPMTGDGRGGCSFCGGCSEYYVDIQNCKGEGLAGGSYFIDIDGYQTHNRSGDFQFADSFYFNLSCTVAPTTSPTPECPYNHLPIEVVYDHDEKPEETVLTLVDMTEGAAVVSLQDGFTYCLNLGHQYTVNIIDCGGDGICCSSGFGNYALLWGNTLLDTAGDFGSYHGFYITSDFLLPYADTFPSQSPTSSPSASAGENQFQFMEDSEKSDVGRVEKLINSPKKSETVKDKEVVPSVPSVVNKKFQIMEDSQDSKSIVLSAVPQQIGRSEKLFKVQVQLDTTEEVVIVSQLLSSDLNVLGSSVRNVPLGSSCAILKIPLGSNGIAADINSVKLKSSIIPAKKYHQDPSAAWKYVIGESSQTIGVGEFHSQSISALSCK